MDTSALRISTYLCKALFVLFFAFADTAQTADFAGVGLQVVPISTGELVVLKVVERGSASAMGVQPGDLILSVDGHPLLGSDFAEIVTKYLWGSSGSTVTLEFLRPGLTETQTVTIRRLPMEPETVDIPGVKTILPQ